MLELQGFRVKNGKKILFRTTQKNFFFGKYPKNPATSEKLQVKGRFFCRAIFGETQYSSANFCQNGNARSFFDVKRYKT